jgi:hypothetical protein
LNRASLLPTFFFSYAGYQGHLNEYNCSLLQCEVA